MTTQFPDLPERMRRLPVDHRGFPVPWFVAWQDGAPFFPAMDHEKFIRAWDHGLCWVCGQPTGRFRTFVIGPMCAVNLTSSEPPCHIECARFSARRCPFLANPRMQRVPVKKWTQGRANPAGEMIERNPGVALVWTTRNPRRFRVPDGHLFDIGDPKEIEWYTYGREATRAEVLASIETGLPSLTASIARELPCDRPAAQAELDRRLAAALDLVPA